MKVGVYPGSFNPVHIGHLALANYLCEFEGFDEIWFLVTPRNPLKEEVETYSNEQRFRWLQSAIKGFSKFKVSDFEWNLPRPHYTIHTLRALKEAFPENEFSLLIGADNWAIFDQWKESAALLNEFQVVVYPRKGYALSEKNKPDSVFFSAAPLMEISSTFIRESIQDGKNVRFFLPDGVFEELTIK